MKEEKEEIEEVWEKESCQNPLEPAQWKWTWEQVASDFRKFRLVCVNSLWWNHHK